MVRINDTIIILDKYYLSFTPMYSNILKRKLTQIIRKYYPQLELKFVFKNSNTIGNFFKFKDVLPASLSSSVIYKTCRECSASYIVMTSKQLKIRISQHMGRSFRTGNINSNEINNSKIFEHFEQKDHPIRVEDFKILTSCPNEDLFILESIYIHKLNPTLNERNSSFDLCILKWLGRYWCMYFWIRITIIIL